MQNGPKSTGAHREGMHAITTRKYRAKQPKDTPRRAKPEAVKQHMANLRR